jgi:hypothetical protein
VLYRPRTSLVRNKKEQDSVKVIQGINDIGNRQAELDIISY